MEKITLSVDGMMCVKCEAHMNETAKKMLGTSKVSSFHKDKKTIIITDKKISDEQLRQTVEKAGYKLLKIERSAEEKKGIFSIFKK